MKFSIILPSWNNLNYLKICIDSIKKNLSEETSVDSKVLIINEHYLNTLVMVKRFIRYYFRFFLLKKQKNDWNKKKIIISDGGSIEDKAYIDGSFSLISP